MIAICHLLFFFLFSPQKINHVYLLLFRYIKKKMVSLPLMQLFVTEFPVNVMNLWFFLSKKKKRCVSLI